MQITLRSSTEVEREEDHSVEESEGVTESEDEDDRDGSPDAVRRMG